jgi:hypothetical protein
MNICFAALPTLIAIDCVQHYTNKNILGFNIIHESILNNKSGMIAVTVLIGLSIICLIWNSIARLYNDFQCTSRIQTKINTLSNAISIARRSAAQEQGYDEINPIKQNRINKTKEKEETDKTLLIQKYLPTVGDLITHCLATIFKSKNTKEADQIVNQNIVASNNPKKTFYSFSNYSTSFPIKKSPSLILSDGIRLIDNMNFGDENNLNTRGTRASSFSRSCDGENNSNGLIRMNSVSTLNNNETYIINNDD